MYKCRHFVIQELVDPEIYKLRGEKAWELFDDRALITLDALRDEFGPIIVNNWHFGGSRKWSGLRTSSSSYYSPTSQHSFGRAFDCLPKNISVEKMREEIIRSRNSKFPYITGLELNVTWIHFDTRNHTPLKTFGA